MDVDYMAGEDDMTFFESEDERWMMGDFDIDPDVDLGRPIEFEADGSVTNHDDSGFQDANTSSGNADPRKGTAPVSGPIACSSAVSTSGCNGEVGDPGLGSSTNKDSNSGGPNLVNSTSKGVANQNGNGNNHDKDNKGVGFQPVRNVRFNDNGNDRGQPSNGSTGNGHRNNGNGGITSMTPGAQPSGSGNSRPSAGGFSFPPGVVRHGCSLRGARG